MNCKHRPILLSLVTLFMCIGFVSLCSEASGQTYDHLTGDWTATLGMSTWEQQTSTTVEVAPQSVPESAQVLTWHKTYDFGRAERVAYAQQTSDGGYIVVGDEDLYAPYNLFILKVDEEGVEQWRKVVEGGHVGSYPVRSVQQTSDGGCIVVASLIGESHFWKLYVLKISSQGQEQWSLTHWQPGYFRQWGSSIQQTSDGGYIVTGHLWDDDANTNIPFLMKINSQGSEEWSKVFATQNSREEGHDVQQASDGGYVIATAKRLIKTDSEGNEEWSHTMNWVWSRMVKPVSDFGYIVYRQDSLGFELTKVSASGNEEWKVEGSEIGIENCRPSVIEETSDQEYLVWSCRNRGDSRIIERATLSPSGDIYDIATVFIFDWPVPYDHIVPRLVRTNDGGFLGYGHVSGDIHLFKTSPYSEPPEPPEPPDLILPGNGDSVQGPIRLEWESVSNADTYVLEVATRPDFRRDSIVIEEDDLPSSEYTITTEYLDELEQARGPFYWRVKSVDDDQYEGSWSEVRQMRLQTVSSSTWLWFLVLIPVLGVAIWITRRRAAVETAETSTGQPKGRN